jgi:hypothetical protein
MTSTVGFSLRSAHAVRSELKALGETSLLEVVMCRMDLEGAGRDLSAGARDVSDGSRRKMMKQLR